MNDQPEEQPIQSQALNLLEKPACLTCQNKRLALLGVEYQAKYYFVNLECLNCGSYMFIALAKENGAILESKKKEAVSYAN